MSKESPETADVCVETGLYRGNCDVCGAQPQEVVYDGHKFPRCPKCDSHITWVRLHGKA